VAPTSWAGATVRIPSIDTATLVFAEFVVPFLPAPADQLLGFWVGLMDGPMQFICQAGVGWPLTSQQPFEAVREFFPDQPKALSVPRADGSTIAINSGDPISVLVTGPGAWGPGSIDTGFTFILNNNNDEVTYGPIGLETEAGDLADVGHVAGCILEHASTGALPNFGTVQFTNFATSSATQQWDLSSATTLEISDANGVDLTQTERVDASTMTVKWLSAN
jgi:hypothetical protein